MTNETLAAALEREHHEIDAGIEEFMAGLDAGQTRTEAISRALEALRRHIYLEEAFLFPPLRSGGLLAAILVMIREHGQLWRLMESLDEQIAAVADPATIRDHCQSLIEVLEAHNFKEERIIYPQADGSLPAESIDELRRFLATGTMPEGWVCKGAMIA